MRASKDGGGDSETAREGRCFNLIFYLFSLRIKNDLKLILTCNIDIKRIEKSHSILWTCLYYKGAIYVNFCLFHLDLVIHQINGACLNYRVHYKESGLIAHSSCSHFFLTVQPHSSLSMSHPSISKRILVWCFTVSKTSYR